MSFSSRVVVATLFFAGTRKTTPRGAERKALWDLADYVDDDEPQVTKYEGVDGWRLTVETHDKMSPEAAAQLVSMCRMAYEWHADVGLDRLVARIQRMRSL